MTAYQLPNFLRGNRKRLGLDQEEVGFLLGTRVADSVCRHERLARIPTLEDALAYEAIYQKPARELFSDLYHKKEKEIAAKVKTILQRANLLRATRQRARKLESLKEIAGRLSGNPQMV